MVVFACCIPVKGAKRSTICDLQRETFDFIPNVLYTILTEYRSKKLLQIMQFCGDDNLEMLEQYLNFLIVNEYIFFSDEPDRFPSMSLDWRSPHDVTNSLIDFDEKTSHNMKLIVSELESVRCPMVQLRFYYSPSSQYLHEVLKNFEGSGIRTVELIIKYDDLLDANVLMNLLNLYRRVSTIFVTSTPKARELKHEPSGSRIIFRKEVVDSPQCCGTISLNNFRVNVPMFTESQKFNSCLNRKVGIDSRGNIKNCPTSTETFGSLDEISLAEVVKTKSFQKVWNISKDMISICKDCEFRHVCTDCRVLVPGEFSKPAKCKYDPYSASWEK